MTDERLALDFLGTFESLRMGPTFARGRRDERAGHVRELTVSSSLAVALVRGPDDPRAFRARIAVRSFGASEWARVERALVSEARFAAALLSGRMPAGIGAVFASAGLSLVPLSLDEVAMDCTCERWPMPCVHLAAACYALARSFEEDPFRVFGWRGRARDELLLHLRDLRTEAAWSPPAPGARPGGGAVASTHPAEGGRSGGAARAGSGVEGSARAGVGAEGPLATGSGDGDLADAGLGAGGHGAAGRGGAGAGGEAGEAADDVSAFWGVDDGRGAPAGERPGAVSRPDALLDQLDPPLLAHDGRPIVDLLRPAYLALPDS